MNSRSRAFFLSLSTLCRAHFQFFYPLLAVSECDEAPRSCFVLPQRRNGTTQSGKMDAMDYDQRSEWLVASVFYLFVLTSRVSNGINNSSILKETSCGSGESSGWVI